MNEIILYREIDTPVGPMLLGASDRGLALCEFAGRGGLERIAARLGKRHGAELHPGDRRLLDRTEAQLREYFAGERRDFELPLDTGGTPWQRRVWDALLAIPYGETRSYGDLARALGRPGASRAVGRANGDNYLAIIIPCHRVIQADGGLRGYGGGLRRKRWLLDHEGQGRLFD
jgi:AraC family transcriptional regulator of adaptative response/methylated-DNA-[protein]-cysteine methyltransferase